MFACTSVLSLAFSYFAHQALALDLDVNSQDSIKSTARTLAGGIVAAYNESLKKDRIPGLFSDDYYWWEAGAVFHGLIEYSHLTGDSQYDKLVSEALQWQTGEWDAFMPVNQTKYLGNEDQSTWGLAAMTAAEVGLPKPKKGEWVYYATNVFDTQVQRLVLEEQNGTCNGGGLRFQIFTFNDGYEYKNAGSNGNFFLLAARLAKFTGNQTYTQWAERSYTWAKDNGLISNTFDVYDGAAATKKCGINQVRWSANHGVYTEGAALMYNITNGAQNWTDAVKGLVEASSTFHLSDDNPILVDIFCERNGKCSTDQRAFKGIAVRSLARAALAAPIVADDINRVLEVSAKGAARACDASGEDVSCSLSWAVDNISKPLTAKDGNLGEVFSSLEAVQALLYPQAKALLKSDGANGTERSNATQSAGASGTSGPASPQNTGSAGTIVGSITAVLAVAFAAALCC